MPETQKTPTEVLNENLLKFFDESGKMFATLGDTGKKLADLEAHRIATDKYIAEMEKKYNADKRKNLRGGDDLVELLGERDKRNLQRAEIVCHMQKSSRGGAKNGMFVDDPVLKTASGRWLAGCLKKLSAPADFHGVREQHEKLTEALNLGFQGVEKVALQEDTATEGGNLVPTVVEGEILRLILDNSFLRPRVRKVVMTTKTHAFPTLAAEFAANIIAEEGAITDSAPANPFGQSNLTAKKLACFVTVAIELMQDNVVGLADWLGLEFGMKIGRLEDTQALEGDGTGVNFTGVVAAANVNAVSSGANGDFLSFGKLADTYAAVQEQPSSDMNWFFSRKVLGVLIRSRVGTGGTIDLPFFIPPLGGLSGKVPAALLGDEVITHSGILTNRAVGTGTNRTNIYYGPPSTIIFGDLLGFEIALNPWAKFANAQVDIRGIKRTGILVGVPAAWTKYTAIDPTAVMLA